MAGSAKVYFRWDVLKITTDFRVDTLVFTLEGSLAGPWVQEVERAWEMAASGQQFRRTKLDLSGITFVSTEGKELLERLFAKGADLFSSDVLTKSIVDAICLKHRRASDG